MKKVISLALATAICISAVACGNQGSSSTTTSTTPGNNSTTIQTTAASTIPGMLTPEIDPSAEDPITVNIGDYAKLIYNPAYCDITYKIEDGVGSKKKITLAIEMKNGYVFDGWSLGNAMANGGKRDSTKTTYTVTVSQNSTIWANYSAQLVYDPNGGTVAGSNSAEKYTQNYSVVWYKCPNTLPEQGYFVREGYTLVEYNTKADGSGESVSLGSKIAMGESGVKELYCIWEKQNDAADFVTSSVSGGVAITKYKGTATNVVIPDTIGGKPVVAISKNAFANSSVTRVVLSKNVTNIENGAFSNCKKLESLVMFDSLMDVSDSSFSGSALKNLQINAALDRYAYSASMWLVNAIGSKMDRMVWIQSKDSPVIAIHGGSGSLHGFDSQAIDEAFGGKYEVVNLGYNAQATAAMYFEYFSNVMKEGDIVLWAPETGSYTYGDTSFHIRAWECVSAHYDIIKNIDISNYSGVFTQYSEYAYQHYSENKNQITFDHFSTDYNTYGDYMVLDSKVSTYGYSNEYEKMEMYFDCGFFDYMAELIEEMTDKGIKVMFTYPAMDENGKDTVDIEYIENAYEKLLTEKFKGIAIISDIADCFVNNEYIYDSAWHLNWEGAKVRTAVVIRDLKAALEKEGN